MSVEPRKFNKKVLLTGAGFSRNWGGRLASEMWEEIFSHPTVQKRPAVRNQLLQTTSFEDALSEVEFNPKLFDDSDRAAMWQALREAFKRMDQEHEARLTRSIDPGGMKEFLLRFCSTQRLGYIFTLNQDTLVERLSSLWPDIPLSLPGIRGLPVDITDLSTPQLAVPAVPDMREEALKLDGSLNYIKLHGSARWQTTDGTTGMVIGGGKEISIQRSPLLTWYSSLFEQVLYSGDVRLLIIGYSFQDDHINRIIARAVQGHGARLFIWDTRNPLQLVSDVSIESPGYPRLKIDLRPFLIGAASRPLAEVFPRNEHPTPEFRRIVESFFS
jgi:hypothetical protein